MFDPSRCKMNLWCLASRPLCLLLSSLSDIRPGLLQAFSGKVEVFPSRLWYLKLPSVEV